MGTSDNKKTKIKKGWWILPIVIVALAIIGTYKRPLVMAYYDDLKYNHYKQGDEMYIPKNQKPPTEILLYRYIKDDSSDDVIMFPINQPVNKAAITKQQRLKVGTYLGSKFLNLYQKGNLYLVQRFYALKPDSNIFETSNILPVKIPTGYSLVDNSTYIYSYYFDNKP